MTAHESSRSSNCNAVVLAFVEDGNHGEYRPRPDEFGHGEWAFILRSGHGWRTHLV